MIHDEISSYYLRYYIDDVEHFEVITKQEFNDFYDKYSVLPIDNNEFIALDGFEEEMSERI